MLHNMLEKVQEQKTEGLFHFSIVVVDNDKFESARKTVEIHVQNQKYL